MCVRSLAASLARDVTYTSTARPVDANLKYPRDSHAASSLIYGGRRCRHRQEAQLSPSDRAMRLVGSNLGNYHATVQKLL